MKQSKMRNLIRRGASLLVVFAVLLTVSGCSVFGGKTEPIDKFFEAMEEIDADLMLSVFPEEFVELAEDEDFDDYLEEMLEALEDEYGDFKITYEVTDEDEMDEDDLDDLRDMMEEIDLDGDEITEAWEIEVEAIMETDDDEDEAEFDFVVFKYNGKWYLDPTSLF